MANLTRGSSGPEVVAWQNFLRSVGQQIPENESGFGPGTEAATIAFQTAQGLRPDGVAGPRTFEVRDSILNFRPPTNTNAGTRNAPRDNAAAPKGTAAKPGGTNKPGKPKDGKTIAPAPAPAAPAPPPATTPLRVPSVSEPWPVEPTAPPIMQVPESIGAALAPNSPIFANDGLSFEQQGRLDAAALGERADIYARSMAGPQASPAPTPPPTNVVPPPEPGFLDPINEMRIRLQQMLMGQ